MERKETLSYVSKHGLFQEFFLNCLTLGDETHRLSHNVGN